MKERPEIKKMPDQKTLETFIQGMHESPKVVFNSVTGEFEWLNEADKNDTNLGKPKTEQGVKWGRL